MNSLSILGTLDWGDWLRGLVAAVISGGASAVTSGVVVTMVDPQHFNAGTSGFWKIVVAMFAANAFMGGMLFLRQNPVPTAKTTTTTVQATQVTPTSTTTIQ